MTATITIRNLHKSFPSREIPGGYTSILKGVSLDVQAGEFICILGSSGCGKSTLLNILAALDPHYDGELLIDGKAPGTPGIKVGYLFQEDRLLPWRTAEENIDFALAAAGAPKSVWKERKEKYFSIAGLSEYRKLYPHQLSGGMRQRLSLVRALAIEPDLLLMDEPFSSLDEMTARRLRMDILEIWRATKRTIVFVTHNSYEASFLADRVVIMAGGVVHEAISVNLPRPRDYDGQALFDMNRQVIARFIASSVTASGTSPLVAVAGSSPNRPK